MAANRNIIIGVIGGNFRLDALQAAILRVKLKYLTAWTEGAGAMPQRYRKLFTEQGYRSSIALPEGYPRAIFTINLSFVVRQRDSLQAFLRERGIETEVYYPIPLHLQDCFMELGYKPGDFPHAEGAAVEALALPIYPELIRRQQHYVVEQIRIFYAERGDSLQTEVSIPQAS